jgi:outer membrane protein assembly factor BamE (lipoprotein component of BamABCDE complex)
MISIGADGKMRSLRQVLTQATFIQVTPGLEKSQVRRLLGRPAKAQSFALKEEEVWDWRFADGQEIKIFSVTFDNTGKVVGTGVTLDPKEAGQLGK